MLLSIFFFLNDTATTEIYTLSLHDALPISLGMVANLEDGPPLECTPGKMLEYGLDAERALQSEDGSVRPSVDDIRDYDPFSDRKSTRLNSSHGYISYAVFCLKKKTRYPRRT